MNLLKTAERLVWMAGILCLATWGGLSWLSAAGARQDLARFAQASQGGPNADRPDMSLWSAVRVKGWEEALLRSAPTPVAVLRIPRIKLEVAVLPGTDDWTLNRGVGLIEDTASPEAATGNIGIAGHRDGFFRGLQEVVPGDVLDVQTLDATTRYRIERTWIVQPEDVSVLDPTPSKAVTLVTCYPFYYIGAAPQRFIVRAVAEAVREVSEKR